MNRLPPRTFKGSCCLPVNSLRKKKNFISTSPRRASNRAALTTQTRTTTLLKVRSWSKYHHVSQKPRKLVWKWKIFFMILMHTQNLTPMCFLMIVTNREGDFSESALRIPQLLRVLFRWKWAFILKTGVQKCSRLKNPNHLQRANEEIR